MKATEAILKVQDDVSLSPTQERTYALKNAFHLSIFEHQPGCTTSALIIYSNDIQMKGNYLLSGVALGKNRVNQHQLHKYGMAYVSLRGRVVMTSVNEFL